ncbi:MAG TPA: polyphosphate kinase 2 [Actinomycetota bacterium]|nr:polyphosphate kinase 2 [Actinomycetota bacterium]
MTDAKGARHHDQDRVPRKAYERELLRLQEELVKMSEWVKDVGARVIVVFEGRDAAGKGGVIKRITEHVNPRIVRHVALPAPTDRQRTEWYFQRFVAELPAGGEVALFDRSWYNRAGIEKVLGFCTPEQHRAFLQQCPTFERLLIDDGILLTKYWFSVSDEEQARRLEARITDPMRQWKLSSTDMTSRTNWVDYSRAKDEMFIHTDTQDAPWFVVEADDKRSARVNCIAHLLTRIPYVEEPPERIELAARQSDDGYIRPDQSIYTYVPDHAASLT